MSSDDSMYESEEYEDLITEEASEKSSDIKRVNGRRLIDLDYFMQELHKNFDNHAICCECRIQDLDYISSSAKGLKTLFRFKCKYCNYEDNIWSEPPDDPDYMNVNVAAVASAVSIGIGHHQLEQFFAGMGVKSMSDQAFRDNLNVVTDTFLESAATCMIDAADEEAKLAVERGHVIRGKPFIPVEVDGSYIKRSYGSKYDSLSGLGVIVGQYTKKVLYVGVCHKYCFICEVSRRKKIPTPSHTCRSNFPINEPSSKMESRAIVEGFLCSVQLHGLIYKLVVSDGDCNVFKSIVDANPYSDYEILPEKVFCTNHLLRNLCRKLRVMSETKQASGMRDKEFVAARKIIGGKIMKVRREIVNSVRRWQQKDISFNEKIDALYEEINIVPLHVFGNHTKCKDSNFFCEEYNINHIPVLDKHGLYHKVEEAVEYLSKYCESLLYGFTTNIAESFHSLVCKTLGGKRINFSHEKQYKSRTAAAAVQHNTQMCLSNFYVAMNKEIPVVITNLEEERKKNVEKTKVYRNEHGRVYKKRRFTSNSKVYYGDTCQQVDLSPETIERVRKRHFDKLIDNQRKRQQIQKETVDQSRCNYWMALRKNMLTASNFGRICNMRKETPCMNTVKSIIYGNYTTEAMKYGNKMEITAREELSKIINKKIESCGLFIDAEIPYLGASPDGLIDEDGIVEIKCPYNISKEDVEKEEHLKKFMDLSTKKLKKKHIYHYQVQGQLHITQRQYCIFAVYTEFSFHFIRVERDDIFWKNEMEPKLSKFYIFNMLPELLDSRYQREMYIRDPDNSEDTKKAKCATNDYKKNEDETDHLSEEMENLYIHLNFPITFELTDKIIKNVLPLNSWLDDLSVDSFLKIIKDTTVLKTQSVQSMYAIRSVEPETAASIQIIGGNCINHWRCVYFDCNKISIFDSISSENRRLCDQEENYLKKRFPNSKETVFIEMLTTQSDTHSCGIYAAAFATELAFNRNPSKFQYSKNALDMRKHFIKIIQEKSLTRFPLQ